MGRMLRLRSRGLRVSDGGIAVTVALALCWACGTESSDSGVSGTSTNDSESPTYASTGGAASAGLDGSGANGGTASGTTSLPAEVETDVAFDGPQASVNYVYAASADADTVAVIDAETLAIEIVETGDEPRFLQTIPGKDAALLIDVAGGDIAYLQTVDGNSTIQYFTDLPAANAIAVAPDGQHAIAYFDVTRRSSGVIETLQDVTVLSLGGESPVATRMTIGFEPRQITFAGGDSGSDAAYVVTDDGVSILNFAEIDAKGSSIARTVPIYSAVEQAAADVSVTPDGKYALGRLESSSVIRLVELSSGDIKNLDLSSILPDPVSNGGGSGGSSGTLTGTETGGSTASVTTTATVATVDDLDLAEDGAYAYAVSRNRSGFVRIPVPGGFSDNSVITKTIIDDVLVGSTALSPNGRWAVLYTTVETEERVVVLDLSGKNELRPVDLTKGVIGVTFSSDGEQAFVVHTKAEGDPLDTTITTEQAIDRSYGYSLIELETGFRKLFITETAPLYSVTVPDNPYVFLTFQGTNYKVQRINTDSMVDDWVDLGMAPVSMGVVSAAQRVFVNQSHTEGRMTFVDWETLDTRSVTGYALNSMIRE